MKIPSFGQRWKFVKVVEVGVLCSTQLADGYNRSSRTGFGLIVKVVPRQSASFFWISVQHFSEWDFCRTVTCCFSTPEDSNDKKKKAGEQDH